MDIFLINEKEKDEFWFPVNPFEISVNRSKKYETVNLINIGEIDFANKGKKIKEVSFTTLLPKESDYYCNYLDIQDPKQTITKLEKWMEQEEPLRLIIVDFDYNGLVAISNIKEEERPGEVGDKYISIDFRSKGEVKIEALPQPKAKVQSNTQAKPSTPLQNNRTTTQSKSKTYTVQNGDSLWKIAKKFYGNGSKWPTIYNNTQNKKVIGKNPNIIKRGQKLIIP